MRDFEEFKEFIKTDCRHEMKEIGDSFGYAFSDEDYKKLNLPDETIGMLMKINGYAMSRFCLFLLERYHEWNESFPESQQ